MIRLCFTAGVARIVELQLNSLTTLKSTGGHTARNAMYASHATHGSDATKGLTRHSEESPARNSDS